MVNVNMNSPINHQGGNFSNVSLEGPPVDGMMDKASRYVFSKMQAMQAKYEALKPQWRKMVAATFNSAKSGSVAIVNWAKKHPLAAIGILALILTSILIGHPVFFVGSLLLF